MPETPMVRVVMAVSAVMAIPVIATVPVPRVVMAAPMVGCSTVMAAVVKAGARLAPATLRELRDAALADEHGHKLRAALARYALV